ncbi:hypothetical protein JCM5353_006341 [Sporobolomyces roseus]
MVHLKMLRNEDRDMEADYHTEEEVGLGLSRRIRRLDRFRKERLRKNKNTALLAQERKHRFNLDKDQALAAKHYKETNFAAEKDRNFDDAKINKVKVAKIEKEKDLRKKSRRGGGGDFWKRQYEEEGFRSGFGGEGLYNGRSYGSGFDGGFDGGFTIEGLDTLEAVNVKTRDLLSISSDRRKDRLYDGGLAFLGGGGNAATSSPQSSSSDEGVCPEVATDGIETATLVDGQVGTASSPVNPQDEVSPDVQPTSQLSKHQLDEDDAEREDGDVSSPESQDVSPDSQ